MAMCNRMPQQYSGIATRMKNMNPVISDFPKVEVVVDNALIKQEMDNFKGRIVKTLQGALQNDAITLDIRIAEQQEHVKILTRREQFELMSKENPAVEKLRQAFDLELA
jgi:DNA polymerase-3 subunit gamma/tau